MGSTKIPEQPAAPDYGAASREAIFSDIETLPVRRLIEQAARLGQLVEYTDPRTGQTRTADFTGLGDAAAYNQLAQLYGQSNADLQRQQLALRQELGVLNAQQTAAEIQAADPLAYQTRQTLTGQVLGDLNAGAATIASTPEVAAAAARLGALDPSTAALNIGLQQAIEDYQRGGALDPATARAVTDNIRAGQVARGNYLGDAAAVKEAATMGQMAEQRRAQALQTLLGVQSQAFGQNQAQNQAALAGAQALSQEDRAARNESFGREQQNLANASAMVLGQPITNQFGALQGAQNGAVGFTPVTGSGLQGLNSGASASGANWAQQNYNNALSGWNTTANIAAQGSPWMALGGEATGAAAGAATAALIAW